MTKTNKLTSLVAVFGLMMAFTTVNVVAQYGASGESGTATVDYPNEATTSTTTVSGNAGDVVEITPVAGLSSLQVTLAGNVSGSVEVQTNTSNNLPGALPTGSPLSIYTFDFTGLNKEDVSFSTSVKVPASRVADFDSVSAHVYNSPAQKVFLSNGEEVGDDMVYQVAPGSFEALVIMGENTSGVDDLIRTGGQNKTYTTVSSIGLITSLILLMQVYARYEQN